MYSTVASEEGDGRRRRGGGATEGTGAFDLVAVSVAVFLAQGRLRGMVGR